MNIRIKSIRVDFGGAQKRKIDLSESGHLLADRPCRAAKAPQQKPLSKLRAIVSFASTAPLALASCLQEVRTSRELSALADPQSSNNAAIAKAPTRPIL